jgi:hypothetical protein
MKKICHSLWVAEILELACLKNHTIVSQVRHTGRVTTKPNTKEKIKSFTEV